MAVGIQGGHTANTEAWSGDQIKVTPYTTGGGVRIGNVRAGDKYQKPTAVIGGNQMSTSAELSIPMGPSAGLLNLQQVYYQPQ